MTAREIFAELQNLDLQNPGGWPRWAHGAAAALLALIVIGLGAYLLIRPSYELLGQEQKKEQDLRGEFERKQKKVAALDAYKAQLAEMERSFGDMLKQLPSKTEVANLLNDISQTRIAGSLEEELFQPLPENPKDFYAEIPNRITVTGSYHQMGEFVSGVAALPRIVTIDEVEIRPASGKPGEPLKGPLRMNALAKTYRYLDPGEVAAKKPGPAGARK
jgi:type IV pilus assembly protein PilO